MLLLLHNEKQYNKYRLVELSYLISEKKPICIKYIRKGLSHDRPFFIQEKVITRSFYNKVISSIIIRLPQQMKNLLRNDIIEE